jgi:hypothetical protein
MTIFRCLLALVLAAAAAGAPRELRCPQDYLDKTALNELVAAKTLQQLEQQWAKLAAPDAVTRLIYAMRRSELANGDISDRLLIDAIPADSVTFDLVYSLCYPKHEDVSGAVAAIAGGSWLEPALAAVIRQRRGYSKILMLAFVGRHNADIGETLLCLAARLKDQVPKEFTKAYLALPSEARKYVCVECC